MKFKSSLTISTILLAFVFACGPGGANKNAKQPGVAEAENYVLTVDTFSTFPAEIEGCSCYFSNDSTEFKQGEYIYMNDFGKISFLKINNVLVKFTQTGREEIDSLNVKETYKSDAYEMEIHIRHIGRNGYETWLNTGTITLKDKQGNSVEKKFYGECGC